VVRLGLGSGEVVPTVLPPESIQARVEFFLRQVMLYACAFDLVIRIEGMSECAPPPPAGRSRRRWGIADADHDSISPARSRLRWRALAQGPRRPRDLKASIPDAYNILHGNVYGWFVAVERGVYNLTETGRRALLRWPQMISPPDLQYPPIGVSRPTIASRSTESEPG
jgi:hypothetical protein